MYQRFVVHKQPLIDFEFGTSCPFSTVLTIKPRVSPPTIFTTNIYAAFQSYPTWNWASSLEKSERFSEKSIRSFSISHNSTMGYVQNVSGQEFYLQIFRKHSIKSMEERGENISRIWFSKKKLLSRWLCLTKTQRSWFAQLMVTQISLTQVLKFCKEIHWYHFFS